MVEPQEYQRIIIQFQDETENEYQSALNKKKGLDLKSIPKWFWFILLFFAYDNLLVWFSTPIIFYPLLLIGIIVALLYAAGYGSVIKNFIKMIKMFIELGKAAVKNKT